ncbi:ComEA family DNA-binding protein [Vampirovibrio sp.]|uniref:ComEA family DNA-binding protein n=1 Tax=Vampirovibrio sp. TaxID=2717857 RepID=UPI003592FC7B
MDPLPQEPFLPADDKRLPDIAYNSGIDAAPLSVQWQANWCLWLLVALTGLMIWMLACLLWPQPKAQIVMTPLPPAQLVVSLPQVAPEEAFTAPEADLAVPPRKKSKSHKRSVAAKKPKHPPVLNLNTASLSQLQLLPGIGPKMAQRIVDYRKTHGAFRDAAQIVEVKGIGPKKFEKLKPFLKV